MKRSLSFLVLALLGFAIKVLSAPRQLLVNKRENLEINRRLDSIGSL